MQAEMLKKLENDLQAYDLILLVKNDGTDSIGGMVGRIQNSRAFRNSKKRILVLPAEKYGELVSLYYTYEFSDKFRVIGNDRRFGGLFNYIENKLLTEEEVYELLLR